MKRAVEAIQWRGDAPIAQLAEAADLKSAQCRFESVWGHRLRGEGEQSADCEAQEAPSGRGNSDKKLRADGKQRQN